MHEVIIVKHHYIRENDDVRLFQTEAQFLLTIYFFIIDYNAHCNILLRLR